MSKNKRWIGLVAGVGLGFYLGRQAKRWGATDEEFHAALPGDEIVPHPMVETTYAITIHSAPAKVWPWLVQMGYDRAGFYTDSWLSPIEHRFWRAIVPPEARVPELPKPSPKRIVPELQDLKVGDTLLDGPPGSAYYTVKELVPDQMLALYSNSHMRYLTPIQLQGYKNLAAYGEFSWVFLLRETDLGATRLLLRTRSNIGPRLIRSLAMPLLGLGNLINTRQMLLGIKRRAEAGTTIHE